MTKVFGGAIEHYYHACVGMIIPIHQAREIKSGYLKNKYLFEDLFNRIIEDIFIVWDYENNRNCLIFVFFKEYQ